MQETTTSIPAVGTSDSNFTPSITVITAVRNGERFIRECIENVAAQGVAGLEHLIIDGASDDLTLSYVKEAAARYPHIRWISERDSGQSEAMNKGLALARASIVSFCNADDFYCPGALRRALDIFAQRPDIAILTGNCAVVDEQGRVESIAKPHGGFWMLLCGAPGAEHPINPTSYFYKKAIHDRIGLYDPDEHYALDVDFILRAYRSEKVLYVDEHFGNMRFHSSTKTSNAIMQGFLRENTRRAVGKNRRALSPLIQPLVLLLTALCAAARVGLYAARNPHRIIPGLRRRLRRAVELCMARLRRP